MECRDFTGLTEGQAIEQTAALLTEAGVMDAEQDARALVEAAHVGKEGLPLTSEEAAALDAFIVRRKHHEPLAYLIGRTSFMEHDFAVDPRTFIPRPVMHVLVQAAGQAASELIERYGAEQVTAVDVGTGCGALGIMLARCEPRLSRIYAIDIAAEALEVAKINALNYQVSDRMRLLQGDLLQPLPEKVCLVMANLPFVARDQAAELAPGVQEYEPSISVFGEDDGWGIQRRMLSMAPKHLLDGSTILVTLQVRHEQRVREDIAQMFPGSKTQVVTLTPNWSKLIRIDI